MLRLAEPRRAARGRARSREAYAQAFGSSVVALMTPGALRLLDPGQRHLDARLPRRDPARPCRFEHGGRGLPHLCLDRRHGLRPRAAVIFERGADQATGVGDEIGDDEDAAAVEKLLDFLGHRRVGAGDDQPCLQPIDVAGVDRVRPRRADLKTLNLLKRDPNVNIDEVQGLGHYTFPMHVDAAPFDNADVRTALKYAVNRQDIVDKVFLGHATPGNDNPIPPTSP